MLLVAASLVSRAHAADASRLAEGRSTVVEQPSAVPAVLAARHALGTLSGQPGPRPPSRLPVRWENLPKLDSRLVLVAPAERPEPPLRPRRPPDRGGGDADPSH